MESSVGICGAGTMGRGIALAVAKHGISTILYDNQEEILSQARSGIEKELGQDVEKNRITPAQKKDALQYIFFTRSMGDVRAPLILEAIQENLQSKQDLFRELEKINLSDTVFATNTSSLSITDIARPFPFSERIVGLHFFNPAHRMKLVEIIRTTFNGEAVIRRIQAFAAQIGKTAVVCRDAPGFIVNHVARPFYLEALRMTEQEMASPSTIDRLMESAGFKMGPFHLMDLIGNDINFSVSLSLYSALGFPGRLKPSSLQEELVKKGRLGKKTGQGFFEYHKPDAA
jgi:3-hydroxybutyryl-CoA dehydrogenase